MTMTSDQTLCDRWTHWLATDAHRRLVPATIAEYRRQVMFFAEWLEKTLEVGFTADSLTAYRVNQYFQHLESQVHRQQRQPATYNKAVAALTSFGTWLVVSGLVVVNPAQGVRTMREQLGPVKALSRDVILKLLDAAHHTGDLRDALVIELLAHSGMRASEVASLQIEQLDMGLRTTWIRIIGKGQKQRRIPLPKHVGQIIQQYLAQRAIADGQLPTHGPLLIGERGGLTRSTINRIVTHVAARARLSPAEQALVTPHTFRHTVATQLVRKRDLVVAADLLGHSSLSTTRRYSKASAQDLEDAVTQLYADET
jgi:site-specific recombinase XerD